MSADGRLYTCLFAGEGHDLRPWLAGGVLEDRVAGLWQARVDRYSEQRAGIVAPRKRVEMFLVGG